jgi:hypothetical protein
MRLSGRPLQVRCVLESTDGRSPRAISCAHNPYAGPLSRRLWEKEHRTPSQYPDTFDYIFTRSDLVADAEYLAAMEPQLASVQMLISSLNRELTRQIEPGAPAPNPRFMRQALGYDMRAHFARQAREEHASLHFSAAETAYYYTKIKELCGQHGLRFSTCYIGNDASGASFQRYQPLWSNRADCYDAVGNVPSFKTTYAALRGAAPGHSAV